MKEVSVVQPKGFFFFGGQGVLYTPVAIAGVLKNNSMPDWDVMKKRDSKRGIAVSVSKRQNKVGCQIEKLEVAGRRLDISASQKIA